MKRTAVAIILALSLCLCLGACGAEKEPVSKIYMVAKSERSFKVYSEEDSVTFEAQAKDTSGNVSYAWYRCNEQGNKTGAPVSKESKLTIKGFDGLKVNEKAYYLCTAQDDLGSAGLIFEFARLKAADGGEFFKGSGTWTDLQTGSFIVVSHPEEGETSMLLGKWNSGEKPIEAKLSNFSALSEYDYKITLEVPEEGGTAQHVGDDAEIVDREFYYLEYSVSENWDGSYTFAGESLTQPGCGTLSFDERYQYPEPKETFVPPVPYGETQTD